MSLVSWKKAFYPTPAAQCSARQALAHSLRKWTGLTKANLRKHRCVVIGAVVTDGTSRGVRVDAMTCALCHFYFSVGATSKAARCEGCPLVAVRGVPCDVALSGENARLGSGPCGVAPYEAWRVYDDVRPMLRLLRQAAREARR